MASRLSVTKLPETRNEIEHPPKKNIYICPVECQIRCHVRCNFIWHLTWHLIWISRISLTEWPETCWTHKKKMSCWMSLYRMQVTFSKIELKNQNQKLKTNLWTLFAWGLHHTESVAGLGFRLNLTNWSYTSPTTLTTKSSSSTNKLITWSSSRIMSGQNINFGTFF